MVIHQPLTQPTNNKVNDQGQGNTAPENYSSQAEEKSCKSNLVSYSRSSSSCSSDSAEDYYFALNSLVRCVVLPHILLQKIIMNAYSS